MPWTPDDMAKKGAKRPAVAASAANAHLKRCLASKRDAKSCEVQAIKIGLFASNRGKEKQP